MTRWAVPVAMVVVVLVLAGRPATAADTMFGAIFDSTAMVEKVVTIDPATGALTQVGSDLADCCFFVQGETTLDPVAGALYFFGRRLSDAGGTVRLIGLDTTTGGIASQPVLSAGSNYNAAEFDSVAGTLRGAAFDTTAMVERVVTIDPVTGALTQAGGDIADCCLFVQGETTLDPGAGRLYFFGSRMSDPPNTVRLIGLDTASGGVATQPILPAGNNYNAIEFDPVAGTLAGAVFDNTAMVEKVVTIDPVTGGLTQVGSDLADCCFFIQGNSTLDPNAGVLYFLGRRMSDPSDTVRLIGLDTASGGIASQPVLPAGNNYNLIEFDANLPPVAVCQDLVVAAGANCTADASIDGGSYDPEGGSVTLSQSPPGPYPLGDTVVTLTVEDDLGLTADCQATVTVADETPPDITCPADAVLECPADTSPATTGTATAVDNCGPASVAFADASVPGCGGTATLTRTWTATDGAGNPSSCDQTVATVDTTPPTVLTGPDDAVCLWPPNHKYVSIGGVGSSIQVVDACDPAPLATGISCQSDQCDDAPCAEHPGEDGDGATTADCVYDATLDRLSMRAERAGTDPEGRTYTLGLTAVDACGNASGPLAVFTGHVPHDASPHQACVKP